MNESTLESAALSWLHELGYGVVHGSKTAPGEAIGERDSFGEVVLAGRLREAIQRLNPAISGAARATIKRYLTVRFMRRLNP